MSLDLDRTDWKRVTFGDVVKNHNDFFDAARDGILPYVAGPHIDPGQTSILRYGLTSDDNFPPTFKRLFKVGDVLLHSRGIEKIGVVDRDGVTGEKLFILRALDAEILDQRFLPWLLASPKVGNYLSDNFSGSVNKFLNLTPLLAMTFDLPPLEEQKRIADLLWATEKHRISISGVSNEAKVTIMTAIRDIWQPEHMTPVGTIGPCVTGSTPPKSNPANWDSEDVNFYTPSEIDDGDTIREASQKVSKSGAMSGRLLPSLSVAVACIGGAMGKSAVIQQPGISNQQITSITGLDFDDAYALQALLAHQLGRAAMEARETTTIVRKLNKSDLMKVEVPWPEDRTVLHRVLRSYRSVVSNTERETHAIELIRSSLLNEIFGDN